MQERTLQNFWVSLLFLAIPIGAIRLFYKAPILHEVPGITGWPLTSNSIVLLIFGVYAFIVCTIQLSYGYQSWKNDDDCWEDDMRQARRRSYLAAILVAAIFTLDPELLNEAKIPSMFIPFFYIMALPWGIIFGALPFLFTIGAVLSVLCLKSSHYLSEKPKAFFVTNLLLAILFLLVGILPTFFVLRFWYEGGIEIRM